MSTLGDSLKDAYVGGELEARSRARDSHRTVSAIRKRRAARAAGTSTVAALGVGAIGAIWIIAPGGRWASPVHPAPTTQCTDAELYLPANPDALGDSDFQYRAYIDLRPDSPTHGVVVVRSDGTRVRVESGADGTYPYLGRSIVPVGLPDDIKYRPMVSDTFADGGGGSYWDGVSPVTEDYAWSVEAPPGAPAGVDTAQLSSSLRVGMGLGGSGYDSSFVPDGAVTDEIITTTGGATESSRVAYGGPSNSQDTSRDVASIALRVSNLPNGATYTLTATHHEIDPALTACAPASPSASASPTASATSSAPPSAEPGVSSDPAVSQGPEPEPLSGPESEVFACGMPLPEDIQGTLGLDVTWETDSQPLGETNPHPFDFGSGGVWVQGELPQAGPPQGELKTPGWSGSQDQSQSLAVYDAVVAVKDNLVVGIVSAPQTTTPPDAVSFGGDATAGYERVAMYVANVESRMEPCAGMDVARLEGAQTVVLLGTGGVGGPYTFAWTPIDPS